MKIAIITDGEFTAVKLTRQPGELLEDWQRGNARALRFVGRFYADEPEDTRKAFRLLRVRLSDRSVRGEWYVATDAEVLRELEAIGMTLWREA